MQENSCSGVMTSQNSGAETAKCTSLYQKCVKCPDYGVSCNGPKLAALGDIMTVRCFHRLIRDQRQIPMKLIYLAAQPISESTINDYFSHSNKDFKWTTVGCIDNALTAICGNRIGQPPLDHPCPATSTEIQDQISRFNGEIDGLKQENYRLQTKVTETKGKVIAAREEVKEDYASRVQFLKDLCAKQQNDIDEMQFRHTAEISRMDALAADYLARIDEKNLLLEDRLVENRKLHHQKSILTLLLVITLIALTCYLVWDIMHAGVGLFQW